MPMFTRLLLASLVLAGAMMTCSLPAQGLRYQDEVFTQLTVTSDIPYGAAVNRFSGETETLLLDRYVPQGDPVTARPAIVYVHGGGFVGGDKASGAPVMLCERFARRGYVIVSINYRLAPSSVEVNLDPVGVLGDAQADFKAAVRFVRAQAAVWGVDPDRIAAVGSSAGAITALTGTYGENEGTSGTPGVSSEVAVVCGLWGAMLDPTTIEAHEAPVIAVHGTADPTVPYFGSVTVIQQAQAVGLPTELHPVVGAGHAPWSTFFNEHFDDVVAFFWEHLTLGQLAGLRVAPGYAAPGNVIVEGIGLAGDQRLLLGGSPAMTPVAYPGVGTLSIDPDTLLFLDMPALPAAPRVTSNATPVFVPASAQGGSIRIQEVHFDSQGLPRLLTNAVDLSF